MPHATTGSVPSPEDNDWQARMSGRVLVVDDAEDMRRFVARALKRAGLVVEEAASIAAARQALERLHPDVVVLDHQLEDGTSVDLMPTLRDSDIPVTVLTGHGTIEMAVQAVKSGAETILTKPVDKSPTRGCSGSTYCFASTPSCSSCRRCASVPRISWRLRTSCWQRSARAPGTCNSASLRGPPKSFAPITILLRQLLPDFEAWDIDLLGTDIDGAALDRARRGEYVDRALRVTAKQDRRRYFERRGGRFHLRTDYRAGVRFAFHNLTDPTQSPPGASSFDLILCRNVTIYFGLAT